MRRPGSTGPLKGRHVLRRMDPLQVDVGRRDRIEANERSRPVELIEPGLDSCEPVRVFRMLRTGVVFSEPGVGTHEHGHEMMVARVTRVAPRRYCGSTVASSPRTLSGADPP